MAQIFKITAEQATAGGHMDVLDIIKNPEKYDGKAYRTALAHINRYIFAKKFVRNKRVIDAACGTGYGAEILNKNNYGQYIGIDVSKGIIECAKEHYKHLDNTVFVCDDLTKIEESNLPFKDCDIFIAFETIEHLSNYNAFLSFVFSVLKKDGVFIVSTPNRSITNPGKSFESKPQWEHHIQEWILPEFIELLKSYNFRIVRIYGQSFYLKRNLSRFFARLRGLLKNKTQSVTPLNPLGLIFEPGFYIILCQK